MVRPKSIVTFSAVALLFGVTAVILSWTTDSGAIIGASGTVLGILWIISALGLYMGDNTARVLLLWLFGFSFLAGITQLFFEMNANGFAWLTGGLGLRELGEAARFALSMTALYQLAGPAAMSFCHSAEPATEH